MHLEPLQSIVTLFVLLACVGCGVYLRWAKAQERAARDSQRLGAIMTGREAVARQLYGEAVDWDGQAMTLFDHNISVRAPWLSRADDLLARSQEDVQQARRA